MNAHIAPEMPDNFVAYTDVGEGISRELHLVLEHFRFNFLRTE